MRPAVYASVVRNRKARGSRPNIRLQPPTFSIRRLLVMVFVGSLLLAPGLILTVLGLDKSEEDLAAEGPANKVIYRVFGPVACAVGGFILFAALFYYFCYGLADHTGRQRHTSSKSNSHHSQAYASVNGEKESQHTCDSVKSRRSGSNSSHRHHHHHHPHHHHHNYHHEDSNNTPASCSHQVDGEVLKTTDIDEIHVVNEQETSSFREM